MINKRNQINLKTMIVFIIIVTAETYLVVPVTELSVYYKDVRLHSPGERGGGAITLTNSAAPINR